VITTSGITAETLISPASVENWVAFPNPIGYRHQEDVFEPSYFIAMSVRYHRRMVSGVTMPATVAR
jgi:hypothetical protein